MLIEVRIYVRPSLARAYGYQTLGGVVVHMIKLGEVNQDAVVNVGGSRRRQMPAGPDRKANVSGY